MTYSGQQCAGRAAADGGAAMNFALMVAEPGKKNDRVVAFCTEDEARRRARVFNSIQTALIYYAVGVKDGGCRNYGKRKKQR